MMRDMMRWRKPVAIKHWRRIPTYAPELFCVIFVEDFEGLPDVTFARIIGDPFAGALTGLTQDLNALSDASEKACPGSEFPLFEADQQVDQRPRL
jgi:hypothetical protein